MKKVGKSIKVYFIGMVIGGITLGLTTVVADTIMNSQDVAYKTTSVKAALDDLYGLTADDIWQKIYPIDSIYISTSSTSPATLFGGTWESFGQGRTLVGMGSNGTTNYDTVEKTGGSETKTIAVGNLPAHTHGVNINTNSTNHSHGTINTTSTGAHTHSISVKTNGNVNFTGTCSADRGTMMTVPCTWGGGLKADSSGAHTHQITINNSGGHTHNVNGNTGSTGSGTALNTQDPYITVYMWKRTA